MLTRYLCLLVLALSAAAAWGRGPSSGFEAADFGDQRVLVRAEIDRSAVRPGDHFVLAVVYQHAPGWHIHTNDPKPPPSLGFDAIATTLEVAAIDGLRQGPIQWPRAVAIDVGADKYEVFGDTAIAFIPFMVDSEAAPGDLELAVETYFQACDDVTCERPTRLRLGVPLRVLSADEPVPAAGAASATFGGFDATVFANRDTFGVVTAASAPGSSRVVFDNFGWRFSVGTEGVLGILLVLIIAGVGGFVLNFTPCVLPVIPIKIMGLSQAAGNSRRCFYLGAVMSAGVVAFWLAIGVLIAGVQLIGAVSELFGNPWFGLAVGVFIALMALGMMGLFSFQLPQAVYRFTPRHDSAGGSFAFGVMTAILGTPCFGPFAGGAAAWAAKQPIVVSLSAFAAIGVGMALPYLILAARPAWVSKLPRTGPASELIKQVMGLLLLAAAAFFIGAGLIGLVAEKPYLKGVLHWWFVAVLCAVAGVWLVYRTFQITRSPGRRAVFSAVGLIVTAIAVGWAGVLTRIENKLSAWQPYDPATFEAAVAAGKVVALDFTADWCINCKVLEATVLSRDDVLDRVTAPGVVAFKADLTSESAPGWARLSKFEEVGIPLLVIVGPGLSEPWKSNAYTPEQVIRILGEAGAAPVADRSMGRTGRN